MEDRASVYAVAASDAADIAAAVNFAREHRLRLVVKGGGHSYQGTSNAPDSLLIWTRRMNDITMHAAFVPQGCERTRAPQPAVTVGAGRSGFTPTTPSPPRPASMCKVEAARRSALRAWFKAAVSEALSKHYGTAAAGLLEAEVVTADGKIRIANACTPTPISSGR